MSATKLTTPFTTNNSLSPTIKWHEDSKFCLVFKNKYTCSDYSFRFDLRLFFSVPNFDWSKNVIIFGVDVSSSVHIDNKKKDALILGKGPT